MSVGGQINRKLPDWIDCWLDYSSILASPEIFRKWAGIGMVAAAMERKVWVRTKGSNLYPNLYTILVGPPGVGKSAVLSQSERMLRALTDPSKQTEFFVAPSSVTAASLVDALDLAKRKIIRPQAVPNFVSFNSLTVVASELGVFLPAYENIFMNMLTKLYDGELYEERRRTGKVNHIRIDYPQLNLIGGTTPSYLNSFLPEGAWDQGFTSRSILIYCGQSVYTPLFADESTHNHLEVAYLNLIGDLRIIAGSYGKLEWTPEAAEVITEWDKGGLEPVPEHGKLLHYNSRRLAHVIKLTMVSAMSRGVMTIEAEDFARAKGWLLEAEGFIPDIFSSMGISGDARAMEDVFYYVLKLHAKERKPVAEHRVVSFLKNRVPSHSVMRVVEVMVRSKYLIPDISSGAICYKPGTRGD